jgi:calcyphosin
MQVVGEMMSVFATSRDGTVHWHEFLDYYKDLSASMSNDAHFELMIRNAYHMSGGQGSAANSRYYTILYCILHTIAS